MVGEDLPRRDIRYALFRLRTEAEGGAEAEVGQDFADHFAKHPFWEGLPGGFQGFARFGDTWDVGSWAMDGLDEAVGVPDGQKATPWDPILRMFSIHAEWEGRLRQVVPELPVKR